MRGWKEAVCPSGQANKCKSPGPSPRCCADLYDQWSMVRELGGGKPHPGPVTVRMGSCRLLGCVTGKMGMWVNELSWAWAHRLSKEGAYRRWTRQGPVSSEMCGCTKGRSSAWLLGYLGIQEGYENMRIGGEDHEFDFGNAQGEEFIRQVSKGL